MEFEAVLEQTIALLQRQGRISYGALKRRFELDDVYLEIARGSYPEAGQGTEASLRQLRTYNEMLHVIAKQLLAECRGVGLGYPHGVFLQVLLEDAQHGGCAESLS